MIASRRVGKMRDQDFSCAAVEAEVEDDVDDEATEGG